MSTTFASVTIAAMNSDPQLVSRSADAMQAILRRSATDTAFRSLLLTDSRAALSQFSGREVPSDLNVKFIEKQGQATYVLPAPVDPAAELSEAELETVAGGSTFLIPIAIGSSGECIVSVAAISAAITTWLVEG